MARKRKPTEYPDFDAPLDLSIFEKMGTAATTASTSTKALTGAIAELGKAFDGAAVVPAPDQFPGLKRGVVLLDMDFPGYSFLVQEIDFEIVFDPDTMEEHTVAHLKTTKAPVVIEYGMIKRAWDGATASSLVTVLTVKEKQYRTRYIPVDNEGRLTMNPVQPGSTLERMHALYVERTLDARVKEMDRITAAGKPTDTGNEDLGSW